MESILKTKSYAFAIEIIRYVQNLRTQKNEFVLSRQLLKSGTAVGALIREAEFGQSKADFINKLSIALKEANETDYWLSLLRDTDYLENDLYDQLHQRNKKLIAMLVSSIKTAKNKL